MPPATRKKTEGAKKAAATRKTVAKKAAVPEPPSPAVETSAPAGDDTPSPSPTASKTAAKRVAKQVENWATTSNGVRFGRL